ncbi:MAG TPA: hypothetical protein VNH42_08120 [Mariprofundaceae bacterium]|nr:hypothetical protein [Mariprofundaceae bacterium]
MINSTACRIRKGSRIAVLAMVSGLTALPALAASPRLDDAYAHLVKTAALLRAAADTGESTSTRMHRERAIRLVEKAEREISLAKQAADAPQGNPGLHTMPRTNPGVAPPMR